MIFLQPQAYVGFCLGTTNIYNLYKGQPQIFSNGIIKTDDIEKYINKKQFNNR